MFLGPALTLGTVNVSGGFTATNGYGYTMTGSGTVTDPTGAEGEGYQILLLAGTATVGGVGYSQPGTVIVRYYRGAAWYTYVTPALSAANTFSGITTVSNSTAATSTTAAALVVTGGVGVGGGGFFGSTVTVNVAGGSTATFSALVAAESFNRFSINGSGTHTWGSGSAAADCTLSRIATGTFRFEGEDAGTTNALNVITLSHNTTGTPAAGIGVALSLNVDTSTTANTLAGRLIAAWSDATHATRTSTVTIEAVNSGSAAAVATFTNTQVALLPTTASTSTTTGALTVAGGLGVAGAGYFGGQLVAARTNTGNPAILAQATTTLTVAVTDCFASSISLAPALDQAYAVTRHNYINVSDVSLTNGATVTDACVLRFDANVGTHKAVDSATTKTTPGGVDAWVKININGTIYYMPAYTSKTA